MMREILAAAMDRLVKQPVASHPDHELALDGLEALESREMLAGNVDVFVSGSGNVRVVGDGNDNQITIATSQTNLLYVSGANGTTVALNGNVDTIQFADVIENNRVRGNLTIDMNGGDDSLLLDGVRLKGNLKVQLDQGSDSFRFSNGLVERNAIVNGGAGADADFISFFNSQVSGNLKVNSGAAAEGFLADSMEIDLTTILGNLQVKGGEGTAFVDVGRTFVGKNTAIRTGGGADFVNLRTSAFSGSTNVVTGSGIDTVIVGSSVFAGGAFRSNLGSGNDTLRINSGVGSTFNSVVRHNGGSGFDEIHTISGAEYMHPSSPIESQFEFSTIVF